MSKRTLYWEGEYIGRFSQEGPGSDLHNKIKELGEYENDKYKASLQRKLDQQEIENQNLRVKVNELNHQIHRANRHVAQEMSKDMIAKAEAEALEWAQERVSSLHIVLLQFLVGICGLLLWI